MGRAGAGRRTVGRIGVVAIAACLLAPSAGCSRPGPTLAEADVAPPGSAAPTTGAATGATTPTTTGTAPAGGTPGTSATTEPDDTAPATSDPGAAGSTGSDTAASTDTTVPTVPTERRITMAFSGDILPHSPLWRQAAENAGGAGFDFSPMLAELAPVHAAVDLAVCHLETPIAPEGEGFTTSPLYGVPAEVVTAIAAAGFDRCSTASNHTADRGAAGIDRTVDVLEAAGVDQVGMARTPGEIEPRVVDVPLAAGGSLAVSHLSYTWSYNGLSLPEGEEWRSALIDPDRVIADARTARGLGAELVVVSLHWGAEGVHEPTTYQRDVAAAITAPGVIDLVVGHHAHVVQPIEQVNGTWVLYGLGNVLSNLPTSDRWPAASQDAVVALVGATIDDDGDVTVDRPTVLPTWVDRDGGWSIRLVDTDLADPTTGPGRRQVLSTSRDRTAAVLGDFMSPAPP